MQNIVSTIRCIFKFSQTVDLKFYLPDESHLRYKIMLKLNLIGWSNWVSWLRSVNRLHGWIARKRNGDLRLCIDPKRLNKVLLREHYQLPTLDDTLSQVFSKLDVCSAYWHLELDDEYSKLTSMITPVGRYRWCGLPLILLTWMPNDNGLQNTKLHLI